MSFLAYIVLVIVLLGMGTLIATMLPTRGARIGLGAVVFLALIVDSTWFVAPLAKWSPMLGDVVWLGVFGAVVFGAWVMADYHSTITGQPIFTWPSERDFTFMVLVIALFGAAVMVLPVPLDTDAQGFGYLSLTLREGGDYTTLAPWHPEIDYLYSPGYTSLIAYLSARFDLGIHDIQLIVSAAAAVLFVWTAYDLGTELDSPRAGRAFMVAALIGTGLITAFMDSHYTALLALLFSLGFLTFVLRFLDTWRWSSALLAAICLAGVPLSQPDVTLALIMGYAPWLLLLVLAKPRPSMGAWLILVAVIPLVALGIVAPWLISLDDLLGSDIQSPFEVATSHWRTLTLTHGGVIVLLAAVGLLIGLRRRTPAQVLMIIWMVSIVEFSTIGFLADTFPDVMDTLLKYDYPFSLAWHGPIIPYTVLGGYGLLWLADRFGSDRIDRVVGVLAYPVLTVSVIAILAGVVFFEPLLEASKGNDPIDFFGAFSSAADVDAMVWLRDNTPEDARVLNHPGPHEADWAPIISERDTVYFRSQPFFKDTRFADVEQEAFRQFWQDPTNPDVAELFDRYKVSYVLVPQVFGNSNSFQDMLRWRAPLPEAAAFLDHPVGDAPFLQLVYDEDGAQVYEVVK